MTIGKRLKYFREYAGISMVDAARELGISTTQLERMENDTLAISFDQAIDAAHLYNCALDDLSVMRNRPLPPNKRSHIN